jgi:uncharacterized protein (TIGR03086 family)
VTARRDPASAPSGALALLAGAIGYALGACARVTLGEMSLPTPCAQWDLRTLLAHLATSMADLESGLRTGSLDLNPAEPVAPGHPQIPESRGGQGVGVPGVPVEVLRDQAANLLCACYDHHDAGRPVHVGGLPLPTGIVACTGAVEIAVHGWDVAAARGRREDIPPALATRMLGICPLLVESRAGLFAPPVEVSPQASPGDRLVAYLGRKPR